MSEHDVQQKLAGIADDVAKALEEGVKTINRTLNEVLTSGNDPLMIAEQAPNLPDVKQAVKAENQPTQTPTPDASM